MNQTYKATTQHKKINKFYSIFLLVLMLLSASVVGQSAEEIIEKHFAQTGGVEAWNQLNSIIIEGEVSIDIGDAVPIKIEHKRPYFKRVSYLVIGQEQLSEGFDGENAFTYNALDGKFKRLSDYSQDAFETDILNYKKKGFTVENIGKEKIGGKDAYKLRLNKNSISDFYWFDAETYDLLKEQNNVETISYADFQWVNGLRFAHRMEATPKGGKEYVVIFTRIIPNAAIDEDRFIFD